MFQVNSEGSSKRPFTTVKFATGLTEDVLGTVLTFTGTPPIIGTVPSPKLK